MNKDVEDLVVDVEIPADAIQLGHDKDGLPKTDPAEKAVKVEPKKAKEAKPDPNVEALKQRDADLAEARRKAFEAQVERDKLARQAQQERDARMRAEEHLDTRTGQAIRAHYERIYAHQQQLAGAEASAKTEAGTAEREYQAAMEAQDYARAAQAQRSMAKAEAVLMQLEAAKGPVEQQLDEAQRAMQAMQRAMASQQDADRQRQEKKPDPQKPSTPEEWIAQFPRATQDWLTEHKDYVTDAKLHRKLLRFADDWVDDHGEHTLHSAEFVNGLNERFFPKAKEESAEEVEDEGDEVEVETAPAPKAKSAPAAPVSRSAQPLSSNKASGNGRVRLTPAQQDAAVKMYPQLDPREALKKYAINLDRLAKDGISLNQPQ